MRKTFRSRVRKMMDYNLMRSREQDLPGEIGEFESFEEFMEEFEGK